MVPKTISSTDDLEMLLQAICLISKFKNNMFVVMGDRYSALVEAQLALISALWKSAIAFPSVETVTVA